ncbi:Flp family type IVb pilin [Orbus sturtevantii]|uniref:Flp family type IVb pilin n=1 Tax=Orbus sturtevantii TaxID=3074109 RepID=UPI00370DB080
MKLSNFIRKFVKNETGVTAIEYAILAAASSAVILVIFAPDGVVSHMFVNVFNSLSDRLVNVING